MVNVKNSLLSALCVPGSSLEVNKSVSVSFSVLTATDVDGIDTTSHSRLLFLFAVIHKTGYHKLIFSMYTTAGCALDYEANYCRVILELF